MTHGLRTERVLAEVGAERGRQNDLWGEQNHPDGTGLEDATLLADAARERCDDAFAGGHGTWNYILTEEFMEARAEVDPARLRKELIQTAAVAVAWVESIDRRKP